MRNQKKRNTKNELGNNKKKKNGSTAQYQATNDSVSLFED